MLLSLKWLKEFVPYTGSAEELGERLTFLGLELEEIRHPFAGLQDLVVGRVEECQRHPDADKLSVCRVNVGQETLDIVCGAPNVAKGQFVAVAPVGAVLPGGLEIKKAKLRGAPSHGMLCSERELGLSEDHSGIMVLEELLGPARVARLQPGQKLLAALDLDEEVLDVSITPNRADCLSVLGLAREAALAFGLPLTLPSFDLHEQGVDINAEVRAEVREPELCPLYRLRLIEDVKIRQSPAALRWRLMAVGLRPISSVVDVTNYVMMELGQPLHAFDADKLASPRLFVAGAQPNEKLTTLDGQERALLPGDITIRDQEKSVALGGVMGGANSHIDDNSRRVLLESAIFRPQSIRRTARRLNLPSDASYRFERGVDQELCLFALNRAAALLESVADGRVRKGVASDEPKPWQAPVIKFRPQRANDLIGLDFSEAFLEDTLTRLGCKLQKAHGIQHDAWMITAPSHRPDLTREVDLIEEAVRVYGMDKVPETLPRIFPQAGNVDAQHRFRRMIKAWGLAAGLNEVINYSFVGQKDLDHLGLDKDCRIPVLNPLSAEQDVMRTALAPGLLQNLRHNIAQGNVNLRLFEIARAFTLDSACETTAQEQERLAILLHGERFAALWPQASAPQDYLDLKGLVEYLLESLHLPAPVLDMQTGHTWLNPAVEVKTPAGLSLGLMGRIRPDMADPFHARHDVWYAELNLDALASAHAAQKPRFTPLPVYPPVRRDITIMAKATLKAGEVVNAIQADHPSLLEYIELIDIFQPEDKNERNLTFRLTFRSADRTLKDAEVDKIRDNVAQSLIRKLSVRI